MPIKLYPVKLLAPRIRSLALRTGHETRSPGFLLTNDEPAEPTTWIA